MKCAVAAKPAVHHAVHERQCLIENAEIERKEENALFNRKL